MIMKAYTDIEQSRHLLEIGIPAESADGFYEAQDNPITGAWEYILFVGTMRADNRVVIPAWSLAALLELMPPLTTVFKKVYKDGRIKYQALTNGTKVLILKDNPIDAAVEMISWLKENKNI